MNVTITGSNNVSNLILESENCSTSSGSSSQPAPAPAPAPAPNITTHSVVFYDPAGGIIISCYMEVSNDLIIHMYDNSNLGFDMLLPLGDSTWADADNVYPMNGDGINFLSTSLYNYFNANGVTVIDDWKFNLYYDTRVGKIGYWLYHDSLGVDVVHTAYSIKVNNLLTQ